MFQTKKWQGRLLKEIERETDWLKEHVKVHGYIKTVRPGEYYHDEYKEMSRSVKAKYFRREGKPLDVFAQAIGREHDELLEHLLNLSN